MVEIMTLKTVINKKGSYILETSICLPIFIIAVIVMSSIILIYSCIEDANFILATELRRAAAEAITANTSPLVTQRINQRIKQHSQVQNVDIVEYSYRSTYLEQDETIRVTMHLDMNIENPINIFSMAEYDASFITRAYVGTVRNCGNMTEAEMMSDGEAVYIFPKRGEKYHNSGCTFLKAASRSAILDSNIKKKYSPCPLCHSGKAELGSLIYYFPQDGEAYHLSGCAVLSRNYIEVERCVAEQRGYTACSKCGG